MGMVHASAEDTIAAPAQRVYAYLADMSEHHPKILPDAFSNFRVIEGGVGAGTVTEFTVSAGGRQRDYRMAVSEPEPGRVLKESDTSSSLVTTFTVEPAGEGRCTVRIETSWQGAGGIGGFFEKTFAPRAMRKIYEDQLRRLDEYARSQE